MLRDKVPEEPVHEREIVRGSDIIDLDDLKKNFNFVPVILAVENEGLDDLGGFVFEVVFE